MLRSPGVLPVCSVAYSRCLAAQHRQVPTMNHFIALMASGQAQEIADLGLLWNPLQEVLEIIISSSQLQSTPDLHLNSSKIDVYEGHSGQAPGPHWGKSHSLKSAPCMAAHLLWWCGPHRQIAWGPATPTELPTTIRLSIGGHLQPKQETL